MEAKWPFATWPTTSSQSTGTRCYLKQYFIKRQTRTSKKRRKPTKQRKTETTRPGIQQYLGRTFAVVRRVIVDSSQRQLARAQQVAMTRRNCCWRLRAAEVSVQSWSPHWWRTWGWKCCWSHHRSSLVCSRVSLDPDWRCSLCRPSRPPSPQRHPWVTTQSGRQRQSPAYLRLQRVRFEPKDKTTTSTREKLKLIKWKKVKKEEKNLTKQKTIKNLWQKSCLRRRL